MDGVKGKESIHRSRIKFLIATLSLALSGAECGLDTVVVKRVSGDDGRKVAIGDNPALGDNIPDRKVVVGETERDSLGRSRVEVDAVKVAKDARRLAG